MKIFLTGAQGMVGQNFLRHSAASSHDVVAPARSELDLADRKAVFAALAETRPDLVVHAAGRVGGIQANLDRPSEFLIENLDLGLNVVLAARAANVPKVLNLGSSCMFPRNVPNPLSEDMILTGELEPTNEGYALAKVAIARLCQYVTETDRRYAYKTLIPCNLYGLYDKFDPAESHLVPAIIHKIHDAKCSGRTEVEIWGDGLARREFMYSEDFAEGLWCAAERFDELPTTMNLGVGRDHTVNDYYLAAAKVIGWRGKFVHDTSRPVGMRQKLVSVELQARFGWFPTTSLEAGLAKTYNYLLALQR